MVAVSLMARCSYGLAGSQRRPDKAPRSYFQKIQINTGTHHNGLSQPQCADAHKIVYNTTSKIVSSRISHSVAESVLARESSTIGTSNVKSCAKAW